MEISDFDAVEAMHRVGGSFVRALGQAWFAADIDNRARLKAAFPELWEEYREVFRKLAPSRATFSNDQED